MGVRVLLLCGVAIVSVLVLRFFVVFEFLYVSVGFCVFCVFMCASIGFFIFLCVSVRFSVWWADGSG